MQNLDLAVLRSLMVAADLGSFAKAAQRLGRTQSALSLQMRRLEDQLGQPLLRKQGRHLTLTPVGEQMLAYARRLLALNDEALAATRGTALAGEVRLGVPQDVAEADLPAMLARFAQAHPQVRVDVRVERNIALLAALERGELDLALVFGDTTPGGATHATPIATHDMVWVGSKAPAVPANQLAAQRPLPLALFDAPCQFRSAALRALDAEGIPWRMAFQSPSLAGLWAAVSAGLGIGVRTRYGLPGNLAVIEEGLPALPPITLWLHRAEGGESGAVGKLAEILAER